MSEFRFKVKMLGLLDMLEFKKIVPKRKAGLLSGSTDPVSAVYPLNKAALQCHPKHQRVTIAEIREFPAADTKHYILKGENLAPFRAGQYLPVELTIGESTLSRAYSLCSDPADSYRGIYEIAVKRTQDGFASAWILDNWKVGDSVSVGGPDGFNYYEPLRDEAMVVGIAGGSGITPLLSMARAVASGVEDFHFTLLYGCRTADTVLFKDELDALAQKCEKFHVRYILSDEEKDGYEHGFITAERIAEAAGDSKYSVFMCGPAAMYRFAEKECEKLGLDEKHIRREALSATPLQEGCVGYHGDLSARYVLTLHMYGEVKAVPTLASESVLTAIDRAGIRTVAHCRGGECGWCRSKLLQGDVFIPQGMDMRRAADVEYRYIHPCCTYPLSDLTLLVWPE